MLQIHDVLKKHDYLWDLYTLREEYRPSRLDKHERFIAAYSSNNCIPEPMVSRHLINNGHGVTYQDDKHFAVCLTHDVDEVYPPRTHTLLSMIASLRKQDLSGIKKQIFWKLGGKENSPYWNFQEIMDLEEKYGAQSSFYFLAADSDIKRFRYNIEDLEDELGQIVDRGWEVGLHGGYYAYNDLNEITKEKKRLEKALGRKVIGYRNHYLRFKVPDSWEILEKAGFEYDTTLGYPDAVGFRNGMCHPFRPYNLCSKCEIKIVEVPMIIMDGTLFGSTRSDGEAWAMAKRLIDTVASCQGVLTLNWHTNNFNCPYRASWSRLYEKILRYCHEGGAWMSSTQNIVKWWCNNAP
ncbi:MAG: hypothetical protein PWQ62_292 [Candidatus Methanomethylophilaceae archaeon]|nr:hypothetical protein [Candidatus Methanomethylophilaceae archaeon]